jgi:hypothetical protein
VTETQVPSEQILSESSSPKDLLVQQLKKTSLINLRMHDLKEMEPHFTLFDFGLEPLKLSILFGETQVKSIQYKGILCYF